MQTVCSQPDPSDQKCLCQISSQFCDQMQLLHSLPAPNSVVCLMCWEEEKTACGLLCNQLEANKKTDMWLGKQILYLISHTLPLSYSKAGQRLGHVNPHSILSMDEGRNPVELCAASIPASSAASWHSTTAFPSEEQGWLPPAESQLQVCVTCTGMKGCSQEPGVMQQHLKPTQTQCKGQFQEVMGSTSGLCRY